MADNEQPSLFPELDPPPAPERIELAEPPGPIVHTVVRAHLRMVRSPRARTTDPDTSHEAAAASESTAATQRVLILAWLRRRPEGCTPDELDVALFSGEHTAGRRLKELGAAVARSDETRPSRKGVRALVWRLVSGAE